MQENKTNLLDNPKIISMMYFEIIKEVLKLVAEFDTD